MRRYPNNILIAIEILALLNVVVHDDWSFAKRAAYVILIVVVWHWMIEQTPRGL